jgi:hypothetical protein
MNKELVATAAGVLYLVRADGGRWAKTMDKVSAIDVQTFSRVHNHTRLLAEVCKALEANMLTGIDDRGWREFGAHQTLKTSSMRFKECFLQLTWPLSLLAGVSLKEEQALS